MASTLLKIYDKEHRGIKAGATKEEMNLLVHEVASEGHSSEIANVSSSDSTRAPRSVPCLLSQRSS